MLFDNIELLGVKSVKRVLVQLMKFVEMRLKVHSFIIREESTHVVEVLSSLLLVGIVQEEVLMVLLK